MNKANEYTFCGMYLESEPTEDNSLQIVKRVQVEMQDNWEIELSFFEALNILIEYGVLVIPTEWEWEWEYGEDDGDNEDEEFICCNCILAQQDERITELEDKTEYLMNIAQRIIFTGEN